MLLLVYFRDFPEEIPLNAVAFRGMVHRPLDLLQSVITLSLRTLDIVDSLPEVTF